jgi:hypothetical protein
MSNTETPESPSTAGPVLTPEKPKWTFKEPTKRWKPKKRSKGTKDTIERCRRAEAVRVETEKTADEKKREAIAERYGISPDQVRTAPPLSALLKLANGGLDAVLESMRFSNDSHILHFLDVYDSIPPKEQNTVPWEILAIAGHIEITALLGAIIFAIQERSVNLVKIIALSNHPDITEKTVKMAMRSAGINDRKALHTALGFLPKPKGLTIINNLTYPADGPEGEKPDGRGRPRLIDPGDMDPDELFPTILKTQKSLTE